MDTRISRRALIASLGAIGLVAAVPEPVKRYWFGHSFEPEPMWDDYLVGWDRLPFNERTSVIGMHLIKKDQLGSVEFVPFRSARYCEVFPALPNRDKRWLPKPYPVVGSDKIILL